MGLKSERFCDGFYLGLAVRRGPFDHFVITLENMRRHLVRTAGIKRRVRVIFDAELNETSKILAANARGQGQGEIDTGSYTAAGKPVAVFNDAFAHGRRAKKASWSTEAQ